MIEGRVYFKTGDLILEGLFAPAPGAKGAVITHPHSLMGGNMRDNVVMALVTLFHQKRFSTLRFNFRGVGGSEGLYDNGVGEVDDLAAAVDFMTGQGITEIILAGYSFGAVVAMAYLTRQKTSSYNVFVSPPIESMDAAIASLRGTRGLMVCGENDPLCPPRDLKLAADSIGWDLEIVPQADHFYFGQEFQLMEAIRKRFSP
jgi:hypothetical protein